MKTYKAIVKDKQSKRRIIIEREYETKADFIKDLRGNGYGVNAIKVKEAEEFDRIINETNCEPWDWNPSLKTRR